eukprot:5623201-Pleurochrysis_carterae.AAC.1
MVAFVAKDAALASAASMRSSSLPLPLLERAYERRAAGQEIVCRINVIIFLSVESISSGATMYRLASSAVSAGKAETEAEVTEAAVVEPASGVPCDCERVCRVVACRLAGAVEPCATNTGFLGEGESKMWTTNNRERQCKA